ncbi:MAG: RHS repeat-associated core domain-containing protein [Fluviicola sp.]
MQMPERQNVGITGAAGYRYAYNGMEQDDEVSGNGSSYTTEFRQYDPRLGRWKSLDPLMAKYPMMSPYTAFNNNPVYFVDPKGLEGEPKIKLSREERRKYRHLKKEVRKELREIDFKRFRRLKHVKRAARYAAKSGAESVMVRRSTKDDSDIIATVNVGGGNLDVDLSVTDVDRDGYADEVKDVGSLTIETKVFRRKKGDYQRKVKNHHTQIRFTGSQKKILQMTEPGEKAGNPTSNDSENEQFPYVPPMGGWSRDSANPNVYSSPPFHAEWTDPINGYNFRESHHIGTLRQYTTDRKKIDSMAGYVNSDYIKARSLDTTKIYHEWINVKDWKTKDWDTLYIK